jgi:pyruvate ferredoxin oxidoreductase gamma subunit
MMLRAEGPETRHEIRLHGRGGQGTVTLAALTVDAAFRSGWHAMGFPTFGTERTGAPVAAFVRLAQSPIYDRSEVRHPDIVAIQDPTLVGSVDVLAGLAPSGLVLVNSTVVPPSLDGARVEILPVTDLATKHLGSPITSTAMLGFLSAATGVLAIDAVCAAIEDRFTTDVAARNVALARAAFEAAEAHKAMA